MSTAEPNEQSPTVLGHPAGLFTLFFAEMWERFSFYGMRALLVFYMIKGFLSYSDNDAYAVYGAYTALVYASPFIGGILADNIFGRRRAVIIGGLLMAAGHLLMGVQNRQAFFTALALLICGNGFFKPNISTIVGELYPKGSKKSDAGFTIFYMGINLGAAMAGFICGTVGETFGWHYGFGLATIGMLIGVAIFAAPPLLTQILIGAGTLTSVVAMPWLAGGTIQFVVRLGLSACLLVAGVIAVIALNRGGVPHWAGARPSPGPLAQKIGVFGLDVLVYLGILVAIPLIALVVQRNTVAGWALVVTGGLALVYILYDACFRCTIVERERLFVILILMFFSMLFWAFFEQAGTSLNNFTDRNVDRVTDARAITQADVGTSVRFRVDPAEKNTEDAKLPLLSQEQLGFVNGNPAMKEQIERAIRTVESEKEDQSEKAKATVEKLVNAVRDQETLTMTGLTYLRTAAPKEKTPRGDKIVDWMVTEQNLGMVVAALEVPASEFQSANPLFILVFGLAFTLLWGFLGKMGLEPGNTVKFSLGLLQLGLGFIVLSYGASAADNRGIVALHWLLFSYLLMTTGELCLSPVGLGMVAQLSPVRIVSTMMGAWFLATAFSQYLAGLIAQLTAVKHEEEGVNFIPPPLETVNVYGDVFQKIGVAAIVAAVICFGLSWLLERWTHAESLADEHAPAGE